MGNVNWGRWIRAVLGVAIIGQAYADESIVFGLIGLFLLGQAYRNVGCNENCEIK